MLNTEESGQQFLDFYKESGHRIIPGSSLLDPSVPMTFVMSAGLLQVETSAGFCGDGSGKRYTMIQNCFRYFDLQNIGKSPFHLSLFQMPGAFTFGSKSRENCIENVWHLLTKIYSLPPASLWATYFDGDNVGGTSFEADYETRDAWKNVGVPKEQIIGLKSHHNFWKQGSGIVGKDHVVKCGPNTEIFWLFGNSC